MFFQDWLDGTLQPAVRHADQTVVQRDALASTTASGSATRMAYRKQEAPARLCLRHQPAVAVPAGLVNANNIYDLARYQLLTAQLDWRAIPLVLTAWSGSPDFDPNRRNDHRHHHARPRRAGPFDGDHLPVGVDRRHGADQRGADPRRAGRPRGDLVHHEPGRTPPTSSRS